MNTGRIPPAMRSDATQRFLKLASAVAVILLVYLWSLRGLPLGVATLRMRQHEMLVAYRTAPLLVTGTFFMLSIAMAAFSLPGAVVATTTAAGAIFGFSLGTIVVSFGLALGSSGAFAGSRYLFRGWAAPKVERYIPDADPEVKGKLGWYLLSLRLIPVVPFFIINIAMGLTRMRLRQFYIVTQLGMLPCVMLYVNAGRQLGTIRGAGDVLSFRVIGALALLGVLPVIARILSGKIHPRHI